VNLKMWMYAVKGCQRETGGGIEGIRAETFFPGLDASTDVKVLGKISSSLNCHNIKHGYTFQCFIPFLHL